MLIRAVALLCLFLGTLPALADTIELKSGQTIDGKILAQDAQKVSIDFDGIPISYYIDEIASINNESIASRVEAAEPMKQALPIQSIQHETEKDSEGTSQKGLLGKTNEQIVIAPEEEKDYEELLKGFFEDRGHAGAAKAVFLLKHPKSVLPDDVALFLHLITFQGAVGAEDWKESENLLSQVENFVREHNRGNVTELTKKILLKVFEAKGMVEYVPQELFMPDALILEYMKGLIAFGRKDYMAVVEHFSVLRKLLNFEDIGRFKRKEIYSLLGASYFKLGRSDELKELAEEAKGRLEAKDFEILNKNVFSRSQ